mgnify:FL=1
MKTYKASGITITESDCPINISLLKPAHLGFVINGDTCFHGPDPSAKLHIKGIGWRGLFCKWFGHKFKSLDLLMLKIELRSGIFDISITCVRCKQVFTPGAFQKLLRDGQVKITEGAI